MQKKALTVIKCTGLKCPMQAGKVDPATCNAAYTCKWATKPLTNADKIRSMTDKELSELFGSWICDCDRNNVPCQEFCEMFDGKSCCERWLDWLKQEVEDGC